MSTIPSIDELVSQWIEMQRQGRDVSIAELCPENPELAAQAEGHIEALSRSMEAFLNQTDSEDWQADSLPRQSAPLDGNHESERLPVARIAGYEILEELGRGGMGVVYKARQLGLKRLVALKMILAGPYAGSEPMSRFRSEAEAVARLKHANIVQIYDIGTHEGRPFFSLELVEGGSLDKKIAGTPMPPRDAAALTETLARTMDVVHRSGLVHRDLKPGNILIQESEVRGQGPGVKDQGKAPADSRRLTPDSWIPKITDFGLVKQLDDPGGATQAGSVLGTPSYMAPEQAAGDLGQIGPATDVYALGAILYELVTGRPPFRAATSLETLEQVRSHEPVPPTRLQPRLPRDLETICLKCLRKEPGRRYVSALELADDLTAFRESRPIRARPVGRVERAWRWSCRNRALAMLYVVSAAAAIALFALSLWYSGRLTAVETERTRIDAEREVADAKKRTAEAEKAASDAEKAKADEIAETQKFFSLLSKSQERATRRRPGWTWASIEELSQAAALPAAAEHMPDILTGLATALSGVDVRPARPVDRVCEEFEAYRLEYDPTGRWLAVAQGIAPILSSAGIVQLVDAHTSAKGPRLRFKSVPSILDGKPDGVQALAFSPDGRWLVIGTRSGNLHRWDLREENPQPRSWPAHKKDVRKVQFSPDGRALYSMGDHDQVLKRWIVADDAWKQAATHTLPPDWPTDFAVSPLGDWVVRASGNHFYVLAPETLEQAQGAVAYTGSGTTVASPDGRTLAMGLTNCQLSLLDVEKRHATLTFRPPHRETAHDDNVGGLAFNPNGTLLASSAPFTHDVRLWDVANGQMVSDWTVPDGATARLAFRPDGRMLAVVTDKGTLLFEVVGHDICTSVAMSPQPIRQIAMHPKGERLVCVGDASRPDRDMQQLSWWRLDGGASRDGASECIKREPQPRTREALAFSTDGKQLAVTTNLGVQIWDDKLEPTSFDFLPVAHRLQYSPTGRLWTAQDHNLYAWDLPARKPVARWDNLPAKLVKGRGTINAVAAGRRWVVVASRDGRARLLRADNGELLATSTNDGASDLRSAALNTAETLAAVGNAEGEVLLLSVPSFKLIRRLKAHEGRVTALAFHGENLLFSGSQDGTVRLTAVSDEKVASVLSLPMGPVESLALTEDGRQLAVLCNGERGVRLWRLDRLFERLQELVPTAVLPNLR